MRFCRYSVDGEVRGFGLVDGDPDTDGAVAAIEGTPFTGFTPTGERFPLAAVRLLAPIVPTKIVCIGKNYADHAKEMGGDAPTTPVVFMKPSTAIVGPGDPIVHPRDSERVDYEGELAIVISRLCRDVPAERVDDVILGYTIANDVTARDQQHADGQWTRGKGHDTFCPLGPWLDTDVNPRDLHLQTVLDDIVVQEARTSEMVHDVAAFVAFVTSFMTLVPGDVLLTGTPAGVGPMRPGQTVSVSIEGIGTLTNPVVARG
ncbi:MAG TPA: fumarylacetoacetate hydrolase family protein [Mycobacteriales bacterium]|nr:fumarylacetoacetate hydrolase family protein [Mycobacteriales bacterium]